MGDFNDILDPPEKNTNVVSNNHRMASFSNHVKQCGLTDMGYNGATFTWCNKHLTDMPIYTRFDRCFVMLNGVALFLILRFIIFLSCIVIMLLSWLFPSLLLLKLGKLLSLKTGGFLKMIIKRWQKIIGLTLMTNHHAGSYVGNKVNITTNTTTHE